jgi:hypothetical protein
MILAAEGDDILRPVEEGGRSLLRDEDLVPLPLALERPHVPPLMLLQGLTEVDEPCNEYNMLAGTH